MRGLSPRLPGTASVHRGRQVVPACRPSALSVVRVGVRTRLGLDRALRMAVEWASQEASSRGWSEAPCRSVGRPVCGSETFPTLRHPPQSAAAAVRRSGPYRVIGLAAERRSEAALIDATGRHTCRFSAHPSPAPGARRSAVCNRKITDAFRRHPAASRLGPAHPTVVRRAHQGGAAPRACQSGCWASAGWLTPSGRGVVSPVGATRACQIICLVSPGLASKRRPIRGESGAKARGIDGPAGASV